MFAWNVALMLIDTNPAVFLSGAFSFSCNVWGSTLSEICLSFWQSNGNDTWAVFDTNASGGFSNNWAAQPEGTETGKNANNAWGSTSYGHPQAYQGPGNTLTVPPPVMCDFCSKKATVKED